MHSGTTASVLCELPRKPWSTLLWFQNKTHMETETASERCLLKIKLVRSSHTNHNVLKTVPTLAAVCERGDEEMNLVC